MKNLIIIYLLILSFSACNSQQKNNSEKDQEMFNIFKKKSQKKSEVLSHADYNQIFDNDTIEGMPISVIEIGKLKVPTGKIVVCDPLVTPDMQPLTREVKTGEFPIKIYEVKTENSGDRYAIAKLEFNQQRAIKWVLALRDGEDINELTDEGDFFGFPVDAGLGGFFDIQAGVEYLKFQDEFMKSNPNGNIYDDFFAMEFKKSAKDQNDPNDYGNWVNFKLPNSDLNITMFQSGYGDGMYPAFWGIDKNGEITSLVIDFFVVLLPEDEE
tara:strand:+ start:60 stop:866 length:807 start_codon:yes stop_codon:yes gene_type:complete